MDKEKVDRLRENYSGIGDKLHDTLYNDGVIMIFKDREEIDDEKPNDIFVHIVGNGFAIGIDIPEELFLNLSRGINEATKSLEVVRRRK